MDSAELQGDLTVVVVTGQLLDGGLGGTEIVVVDMSQRSIDKGEFVFEAVRAGRCDAAGQRHRLPPRRRWP